MIKQSSVRIKSCPQQYAGSFFYAFLRLSVKGKCIGHMLWIIGYISEREAGNTGNTGKEKDHERTRQEDRE